MRETTGRNAPQVKEVDKYAVEHNVDLRAIELDVSSQESSDTAIEKIINAPWVKARQKQLEAAKKAW